MSNYSQSTFFTPKDSLSPGDPLKVIKGADIDPEFSAISVAIATKVDTAGIGLVKTSTTLALGAFDNITTATPVSGDYFVFTDISDSDATKAVTLTDLAGQIATEAGSVPTSRNLTAGVGISGGGDLSANRSFALDLNELTAVTPTASDSVSIVDASDSNTSKKATVSALLALTPAATTGAAGVIELATQAEVNTGTDTTRAVTPDTLANWTGAGKGFELNAVNEYSFTNVGTYTTVSALTCTVDDASAHYLYELEMRLETTTGGFEVQVDFPAADSIHRGWSEVISTTNTSAEEVSTGAAFEIVSVSAGSSQVRIVRLRMFLEPSATGSCIVQVRQETQDANSSVIQHGFARLTKLDDHNS